MKCFIFFALVACIFARALAGVAPAAVAVPAAVDTGSSVRSHTQDNLGNYAFGYDEAHATGGSFRREHGNALGVVKGSYGLRDADGRTRVVNYIADALGFRANIQTNEPGVDPAPDPAATLVNKAPVAHAVAAVAPAATYAAPAIAAPAYAAHAIAAPAYAAHTYAAPAIAAAPAVAAPVYAAAPAYAHGYAAPVYAGAHYAGVPAYAGYGHHKVIY